MNDTEVKFLTAEDAGKIADSIPRKKGEKVTFNEEEHLAFLNSPLTAEEKKSIEIVSIFIKRAAEKGRYSCFVDDKYMTDKVAHFFWKQGYKVFYNTSDNVFIRDSCTVMWKTKGKVLSDTLKLQKKLHGSNVHQATIDIFESVIMDLMDYQDEVDLVSFSELLGSLHYKVENLLDICNTQFTDYKFLLNLVRILN